MLCARNDNADLGPGTDQAAPSKRPIMGSLDASARSAFVVDWALRIIHMNQAFEHLTGFCGKDLEYRRVRFRVHPEDRERAESSVIMAIVGRTAMSRCRVRGPKGAYHPLALRFCPLRFGERTLVLCVDMGPGAG